MRPRRPREYKDHFKIELNIWGAGKLRGPFQGCERRKYNSIIKSCMNKNVFAAAYANVLPLIRILFGTWLWTQARLLLVRLEGFGQGRARESV